MATGHLTGCGLQGSFLAFFVFSRSIQSLFLIKYKCVGSVAHNIGISPSYVAAAENTLTAGHATIYHSQSSWLAG